jgi:hypothetical protein
MPDSYSGQPAAVQVRLAYGFLPRGWVLERLPNTGLFTTNKIGLNLDTVPLEGTLDKHPLEKKHQRQ